jgi:mannose-6-phosphate isomerase-like protein (cupin superfamily)
MTVTDTALPLALAAHEGDAYWWTGELATVKAASADTNGHLALVEILAPEGVQIPLHVHHREDEGFWVLEGELTFTLGGQTVRARAGDFLLGPRGVPHTYTVDAGPARLLFLFAPAGLEELIRRTGVPAQERSLPPAWVEQDMELLALLAPEFGIELVG